MRSAALGLIGAAALLTVACGPAAESTATTVVQPTATKSVQPTATTAAVATATGPAVPTATVAETKVRPIPVLALPPANPKAVKGGVYRSLTATDPSNFGIWDSANGGTFTPAVPVHDSLLERNEYEEGKAEQILPNLAVDWWIDQAGTTWTFKLKEGVKYTDGKDFTCADARFSLMTIRDTRDPTGKTMTVSPRADYIKRVQDISCPDPLTLQIKTDGPLPSLPATLALSTYAVQPRHIFEGNLNWAKSPGIGMGPFTFVSYTPTEIIKLKRNPNYWQQPYPYLEEFHIPNLGSATAVEGAFRVGRGESGSIASTSVRDQLISEGKIVLRGTGVADGFYSIEKNWQKAPFNDKRFSQVMRCAINSRIFIDTALNKEGWEGPIFPLASDPNGSPYAITKEEWKAISPCHGPTAETNMDQRRQIAKDLLTQMGFGATNPAKVKVVWPESSASKSQWVPVESDLKAVGLLLDVEFLPTARIYDKFAAGEFDMGHPAGYETSRRDPDHWLYEHYSSTSARNYGRYVNAEADALIAAQSKELDPTKRQKLLHDAEKLLLKDNAKIVLAHRFIPRLFSAWVMDQYWGRPANSQSTSAKWKRVWLDQAKMKQITGA